MRLLSLIPSFKYFESPDCGNATGAFFVRPARAHSCECKSRCDLVTTGEVKRNCMRVNGGTLVSAASSVSPAGRSVHSVTGPNEYEINTKPPTDTSNTLKFTRVHACMVCHAIAKVADIKSVHTK